MKPDGSGERVLTEGYHNEGPTWAPNGRVIMFTRQGAGATGEPAHLWGTSIVGFGSLAMPGARGASTPWPVVAFAPRSTELVLYLNTTIEPEWFDGLGPHRRGVGCVYVKRLDALDLDVLRRLIERSIHLATA